MTTFENRVLQNHCANFNQTWHRVSFGNEESNIPPSGDNSKKKKKNKIIRLCQVTEMGQNVTSEFLFDIYKVCSFTSYHELFNILWNVDVVQVTNFTEKSRFLKNSETLLHIYNILEYNLSTLWNLDRVRVTTASPKTSVLFDPYLTPGAKVKKILKPYCYKTCPIRS